MNKREGGEKIGAERDVVKMLEERRGEIKKVLNSKGEMDRERVRE